MKKNLSPLSTICGLSVLGGVAFSCNKPPSAEPAKRPPQDETAPEAREQQPQKSAIAHDEKRQVLFGNIHVHTSYSFDAVTNGALATPADAYRWARGEAITAGKLGGELKIQRPLDFYAVSDHAEYLGVFMKMFDPEHPASKLPLATDITSKDQAVAFKAYAGVLDSVSTGEADPELANPELSRALWKEVVKAASDFNEPGKFTTFPAFEWTANPDGLNLHRIVLFESDEEVPDLPFSALDSDDPRELWKYMDEARAAGAKVLAVPHNGNASDGLMFLTEDENGKPLSTEYAQARMANEPLYEISQIKGTSETHPILSPNDEFAGFELWDYLLASTKVVVPKNKKGSYARKALLDGMSQQADGRGNPYQMGFIGDSDTHNAASTVEEDNYTGKFGMEASPKHRLDGPIPGDEVNNQRAREFSSGGLAAVWAKANTRAEIFAAMKRKETYATSGTRLRLRFFAGWAFAEDFLQQKDWVQTAYSQGAPMGSTMPIPDAKPKDPKFVVHALKDPDGANLDRIQIIKGWLEDGEQMEKIYDVAWSGDREPGKDGKVPAVGTTVNVAEASYDNSIGAAELSAVWTDPDFDPDEHAVYYVRVIEIPTPRWSTYDAKTLGVKPLKSLPETIQERAWSSPIWFVP